MKKQPEFEEVVEIIRAGDGEALRKLLDDGLNPNMTGKWGVPLQHVAQTFGRLDLKHLLQEYGADPFQIYMGSPLALRETYQGHSVVFSFSETVTASRDSESAMSRR